MHDTCSFWWVLGKQHMGLYSIVPLIHRMIALSKACQQVKSHIHLIGLWLAKIFNLAHMISKLRSSGSKHHNTYWSIPKSPLHAMTFLHLLESGNMASSQSNMFSHFSFHLRNLWHKLSFTVQSIFGPSTYGINMGHTKGCGWLVDGWINCWLWASISTSEVEHSCETIEVSWQTLVFTTWAEFFFWYGYLRTLDICSQATSN